jgi:hypothetical protein
MQATTSQKAIDLRPAIMASLAIALLIAGIALGSVLVGTTSTATAVAGPDTSYTAVEGARAQFGVPADKSYNAVEDLRTQWGATVQTEFDFLHAARAKAAAARAESGVTVDTSLVGKSGFPSSRGISQHDVQRGAAGWWASAPEPAQRAPELERDGAFGHGYR